MVGLKSPMVLDGPVLGVAPQTYDLIEKNAEKQSTLI